MDQHIHQWRLVGGLMGYSVCKARILRDGKLQQCGAMKKQGEVRNG